MPKSTNCEAVNYRVRRTVIWSCLTLAHNTRVYAFVLRAGSILKQSNSNKTKHMKSITENKLIQLFDSHYGNESMNLRLAKLIEEVNELQHALMMHHPEEDIKAEIADVYSVIMDIAARYELYQTDVVAMTVKKHQEMGKL